MIIPFGFLQTRDTGFTTITELTSLEHDTVNNTYNSLVKIDDTHFIVAYAGDATDGYIKTFSVDGSYNVTEINSLEHDTVQGNYNSLVMIDSTHFMLAYTGSGDDGFIKTFSIDGSYNITQIDSLEHDTTIGYHNSLVKIDSTHFALAYTGTLDDGYIKIFSIDGSYIITELTSLEHDTDNGTNNSMILLDSTHLVLAYGTTANAGILKTFSFDGSYNVTELDSSTYTNPSSSLLPNSLVKIDDTHFMLAHTGVGTDGYIKTFSVDGSYIITEIDSLEHNILRSEYHSLVKINNFNYALASYQEIAGPDFGLMIKLFSINGSYIITQIDDLFSDINTTAPWTSMILLDSDHLVVAYSGLDADGYIKTYSLT